MEHPSDRNDDFRYEIEFANELIELDVYRLLTILYSSKSLHTADIFGFPMMSWKFELAEIYRIVFNLAIRARNILDKSNAEIKIISANTTGKLEQNSNTTELSFREACNKIIHSEHINFGIIPLINQQLHGGVTEFIYVYGKKGKDQWKATINLIQFSDIIMRVQI